MRSILRFTREEAEVRKFVHCPTFLGFLEECDFFSFVFIEASTPFLSFSLETKQFASIVNFLYFRHCRKFILPQCFVFFLKIGFHNIYSNF